MKKPLKIGLALVIGASVLGIFSDPEPSENRTYEEQQVEEQTPEKDWHEQVLKSLEQKEETEIQDYDQKTQYVDLMKSSLDQDLPVRSLTIKGEGERIQSAVVTIDLKNFEESAQIDHSFTPAGYKEITSENIEGGEFFVKNKILPCKTDPASNNQLTIAATHSFQNGISYWESQIKQYLDDTNNHVLVRADLIYEEEAALCSGIILQARSIEDDELSFKAYVYNEEPDFKINKQTSEIRDLKKEAEEAERARLEQERLAEEARLAQEAAMQAQQAEAAETQVWIPQTGHKYHSDPNCSGMKNPSQVPLSQAQASGFGPCKKCY